MREYSVVFLRPVCVKGSGNMPEYSLVISVTNGITLLC